MENDTNDKILLWCGSGSHFGLYFIIQHSIIIRVDRRVLYLEVRTPILWQWLMSNV